MSNETVVHGKADWPIDSFNADGGYVHITGRHRFPSALEYSLLMSMAGWAVLATIGWLLGVESVVFYIWSICAIAPIALLLLLFVVRRKLDIKISRDAIELYGTKFPRNVPVEFSVEPHSQSITNPQKHIYRGAIETVMRYGERRVSVAEMPGKDREKAIALALRLQNWCENFDEALRLKEQGVTVPSGEAAMGDFGPAPDVR